MRIAPENQRDSVHAFTGDSKFNQVARLCKYKSWTQYQERWEYAYTGQWSLTSLSPYFFSPHFIPSKSCLYKLFPEYIKC